MQDSFDSTGLQIRSLTELSTQLTTQLQGIYGADINVDSNSPDGQMIGIVSQAGIDLRELLLNVNAGFDPDQAEGITLDQRVALVGIKRQEGSFTTVEITLVTSKALSLIGLDSQVGIINPVVTNLYTIKDNAGNLWYLVSSQSPSGAGTYSYLFQSATLGAVLVTANTITTPVSIVGGVVSVNNPLGAYTQGANEESDMQLRIRFHKSTTSLATGFSDSLEAALQNLAGVTAAVVHENNTGSTDAGGTLAHTVWCVVEGGIAADIAAVIFSKRSGGCGLRGAVTYSIARPNNQVFIAQWDTPVHVNIYVQMSISIPGGTVDPAALAQDIVNNVIWSVGQDAIGSTLTAYLLSLNPNYRVSGMGLSTNNITYVENLLSASAVNRFIMDVSRITIS
jgi:uncharacterized phage protein gp47/JayE